MFVLCALMENVFYKAQGSRLLGSKELLHKVILPLSYLMWCTINLSSQVVFSHLLYFFLVCLGNESLLCCAIEGENVKRHGHCFAQWAMLFIGATKNIVDASELILPCWNSLPTLVQKDTQLDHVLDVSH